MYRLFRPGGVFFHRYDPVLNVTGGHSHATLDFPWGQMRLTPDEFAEYVDEYRAFERDPALKEFHQSFKRPVLPLGVLERLLAELGLATVFWQEAASAQRAPYATESALVQCRRTYPTVTRRDLLAGAVTIMARRH